MENKKVGKKNIKSKSHIYTDETVKKAMDAIAKGLSVRAASKEFSIPFSTLRCKHKGIYPMGKRCGPSTILTDVEEQRIVDWIIFMASKGFPLTKTMVLDSVQLLIKELKRENPFTGGRPGRHWYEGFLKRHPQLSMRTPQNLNKRRADVTEEQLRSWYQQGNKVIVEKKLKSVHNLVGANDKECLTALITGNAAGQMPPPMVMFAYKRLPAVIVEKVPHGWSIGTSDSGWMTGESFLEYITNIFHPWCISNNIQFPIILFVDGHSSHSTMALSDFCLAHEIELISLYPNSTHVIQPIDVALFKPLKNAWRKSVTNWRIQNDGVSLKKSDFASVLKSALESLHLEEILSNGFACCGLWPFSEDAIDYTRLLYNKEVMHEEDKNVIQSLEIKNENIETLQFIESSIGAHTLELFKTVERRNNEWNGEEKYKELFSFWLNCKRVLGNGVSSINF